MGAGMRRVAVWVLRAAAAVLTFVVVFRITRLLDHSRIPAPPPVSPLGREVSFILREVDLVVAVILSFGWVKRHLPTHRSRIALLDLFAQSRVDSPEFTADALQHFRWRSRLLAPAAGFICLLAILDLLSAFAEVGYQIPATVLSSLGLLLYGGMELKAEMRRLRALAGAASSDDASRSALVRSLAYDAASADPISRAICRRLEPETHAPALAGEASASIAAT